MKMIKGHEDVFMDMVLQCIHFYEQNIFIKPDDKYCLLRVLPVLLLIIDGSEVKDNVFKQKRLRPKLTLMKEWFAQYPLLPTSSGGNSIYLKTILKRSLHYDEHKENNIIIPEYEITTDWYDNMCTHYDTLMTQVQDVIEVEGGGTQDCSHIAAIVSNCFISLREWTCRIRENFAWKINNPYSGEMPQEEGLDYKRLVFHNFNFKEISIIVDVITRIKCLANYLKVWKNTFSRYVQAHVHNSMVSVAETDFEQFRYLCVDWKDSLGIIYVPAAAQLYSIRSIIREILHTKSKLSRKNLLEAEILSKFYDESYNFPALLNIAANLEEITDLSDLFFRKLHSPDSPLEYSMPYILIEHVVNNKYTSCNILKQSESLLALPNHQAKAANQAIVNLAECLTYLLDIYNDADRCVSKKLQHLRENIGIEAGLVLEHIILSISQDMHCEYKELASNKLRELIVINHDDPNDSYALESFAKIGFKYAIKNNSASDTKNKQFCLMKRCIDFRHEIGQEINSILCSDTKEANRKFEDNSDLFDFLVTMKIVKGTTELLKYHLDTVNDFEAVLIEADLFENSVEAMIKDGLIHSLESFKTREQIESVKRADDIIKKKIAEEYHIYKKEAKKAMIQVSFKDPASSSLSSASGGGDNRCCFRPNLKRAASLKISSGELQSALPPNFLEEFEQLVSIDIEKLIKYEAITARRRAFQDQYNTKDAKKELDKRDALNFTLPEPHPVTGPITGASIKDRLLTLKNDLQLFYTKLCDDEVHEDILDANLKYFNGIEELLDLFKSLAISTPRRQTLCSVPDIDRVSLAVPLSEAFVSGGKCKLIDGHFMEANTMYQETLVKVKLFSGEHALKQAQREYNFMVYVYTRICFKYFIFSIDFVLLVFVVVCFFFFLIISKYLIFIVL